MRRLASSWKTWMGVLRVLSLAFASPLMATYCTVAHTQRECQWYAGDYCCIAREYIVCDDPNYNCYYDVACCLPGVCEPLGGDCDFGN